jgi:23S rRNA (adenine2503-C2)-methyltransferase
MTERDIKSLYPEELAQRLKELGEPSYRAAQVFDWLHKGIHNFDEMTNVGKGLRQKLSEEFDIFSANIEKKLESSIDDTVKYLYRMSSDGEFVESVLMRYHYGDTVCVSPQVGCRMGCRFCASGQNGLYRSLTASEMLSQLTMAQIDNNIRVSNVVMMGMGEPLDNFDNSVRFLKLVSHPNGMNIGLRHISLSTSGVVDGIYKLANENLPITLSISLHAPSDEIRSRTMPINNKWNIDALLKACKDYQKVTTRRISFEYAMIKEVNDTKEHAKLLAKRLKGIMCHVNLIPANPVVETDFTKSDNMRIENFKNTLEGLGLTATVRRTLGADINASCGQLRRAEQRKEDV